MNLTFVSSPIILFLLNVLQTGNKTNIDTQMIREKSATTSAGSARLYESSWGKVVSEVSPAPVVLEATSDNNSLFTSSASQAVESIAKVFSVLSNKNSISYVDESTIHPETLIPLNFSSSTSLLNLNYTGAMRAVSASDMDESFVTRSPLDMLSVFTFEKQLTPSELLVRIIGAIFCIILIATTIFGNTLVLIVIIKFHRMRTVTNILLASLAIADITVAIFVMPFLLMVDLIRAWPLGYISCHLWISCDVMCCTASILHLCAIAIDRFWAITRPLRYRSLVNKRRLFAVIAIIWFASAAISFIPIFSGLYHDGTVSPETEPMTDCSLKVNQIYAVVSSMTSFYLPLPIMFYVYFRILLIAKNQVKGIRQLQLSLEQNGHLGSQIGHLNEVGADFISVTDLSSSRRDTRDAINVQSDQQQPVPGASACIVPPSPPNDAPDGIIPDGSNNQPASSSTHVETGGVSFLEQNRLRVWMREVSGKKKKQPHHNHHSLCNAMESLGLKRLSATSTSTASNQGHVVVPSAVVDPAARSVERSLRRRSRQLVTDTKAIRTLGIVMGVFCACWFPFFIMYVVGAFCTSEFCNLRYEWRSAITWLGYVNSSINPLIYSFTNKEFKLAFKRVICFNSASDIYDYTTNLTTQGPAGGGGGGGGGPVSTTGVGNCHKGDQLSSHYRGYTSNDPFNVRYFSSSRAYSGVELDGISSTSCTGAFASTIHCHNHTENVNSGTGHPSRHTSSRGKSPINSCLKPSVLTAGSFSREKNLNVVFDIPSSASSTATPDLSGVNNCPTTSGSYGNISVDSTSSSASPLAAPRDVSGETGGSVSLHVSTEADHLISVPVDQSTTVKSIPSLNSSLDVSSPGDSLSQVPASSSHVSTCHPTSASSVTLSVLSSPFTRVAHNASVFSSSTKVDVSVNKEYTSESSASIVEASSDASLYKKQSRGFIKSDTVVQAGPSPLSSSTMLASNNSVNCQRTTSRRFRVLARQKQCTNESESTNDGDVDTSGPSGHRSNVSLLSSQWSLISMGDKCNASVVQATAVTGTKNQVTGTADNGNAVSLALCVDNHSSGSIARPGTSVSSADETITREAGVVEAVGGSSGSMSQCSTRGEVSEGESTSRAASVSSNLVTSSQLLVDANAASNQHSPNLSECT